MQENFLLKFQVKNNNNKLSIYKILTLCLCLCAPLHAAVSLAAQGMKLSSEEFNAIFAFYDKVRRWG